MSGNTIYRLLSCIYVFSVTALPSGGEITAEQTLLLYNSRKPESMEIHDAYIATHPGILEYDLNLDYPDAPPRVTPEGGINNQYITPSRYRELFYNPDSEFRQYLLSHPEILVIVTTRGLPAAVSDSFDPAPRLHSPQEIHSSFEAALSRPGFGILGEKISNPYYGSTMGFAEFLDASPDINPGDIYLVSRLDSKAPTTDVDGDGDIDEVDGVIGMINRSVDSTVNIYASSIVVDGVSSTIIYTFLTETSVMLWNHGWCVQYDGTSQFIHGVNDPSGNYDPETDGIYNEYPMIGLITLGTNQRMFDPHSEYVDQRYVQGYIAHNSGVFISIESGNGWMLHDFDNYAGNWHQGQVLEWTGVAGGSFTIGNIQEPTIYTIPSSHYLFRNFLVQGLSWAESAYVSLPYLGFYQTPVGDPLAHITALNPDVSGDRVIDNTDLDLVQGNIGMNDPSYEDGDINHDGVIDQIDVDLVLDAFGRDCASCPLPAWKKYGIGDLNNDCYVGLDDLSILLSQYGTTCDNRYCSDVCADLNGDGNVNLADLSQMMANYDTRIGDFNGDGITNLDDLAYFLPLYTEAQGGCVGDPQYEQSIDIDRDGCIGSFDLGLFFSCYSNG